MKHLSMPLLLIALSVLATPAVAEATGGYNGLGRALTQLFFYAVAYLTVIITLIVLAVKRRKKPFMTVAAISFGVLILYPLLDTVLIKYQQSRVEGADIRKPAPLLEDKTILYASPWDRCYSGVCEAMLELEDGAPLWALSSAQFEALDFSQPIDLASTPLSQWIQDPDEQNSLLLIDAPEGDRPVFDYFVFERRIFYRNRATGIVENLPQTPKGTFLGQHLSITDLAAPLQENTLDISTLEPDLLTFYISRDARAVPLFVENTITASERDWKWRASRENWYCGDDYQTRTILQRGCSNSID